MQDSQIPITAANISTTSVPDAPPDIAELPPSPTWSPCLRVPRSAPHAGLPGAGFLLLYGLIPTETRRPDLAMVLGVAAEF